MENGDPAHRACRELKKDGNRRRYEKNEDFTTEDEGANAFLLGLY